MTTPKINTTFRGGSRYYLHPETSDKVPGVTSVIGMLPKPFLKAWGQKEVATAAVRSLDGSGVDWLSPMVAADPDGAISFLKDAPKRNTQQAADEGTAAHGIFETLALGEPLGRLTPSMEPYARQYRDLLDQLQPEVIRAEDTVWSERHSYAGSFDLLAKISGEVCWIDNKTTRSGVYAEVALQLAAYAHADYVFDSETSEQLPIPAGTRGLVFHVRPDAWAVYEVPVTEEVFDYFLALRKVFTWDAQVSRGVVKRPLVKGAAA
jgi:hypothetical protein